MDIDAGQGQTVSRLRLQMATAAADGFVRRKAANTHPVGAIRSSKRLAIIDECVHRDPRGQFSNATDVVPVKMADEQKVDALDACVSHSSHDPVGIAAGAAVS